MFVLAVLPWPVIQIFSCPSDVVPFSAKAKGPFREKREKFSLDGLEFLLQLKSDPFFFKAKQNKPTKGKRKKQQDTKYSFCF